MFMYFSLPHWVSATWRSLAQTSIRAELPSGNVPTTRVLRRIGPVQQLFRQLLAHAVMPVAALTSQVISNVPAAILLSRFTDDYRALLVGVNIGGAGTLVASLASLITFREYTKHVKGQAGWFMALFSAISFGFLAVLLAAMTLWMQ